MRAASAANSLVPALMSATYDLRAFRIRTLQQAYSAQQLDLPLLEERIDVLHDVITHAGTFYLTPSELAQHHHDIGVALHERYLHLREVTDLEQAETYLRRALPILPQTACFPCPSSVLGSVLRERAYEIMDALIAEEAVSLHRRALLMCGNELTLEKAHHLRELGMSLRIHHVTSTNEDTVSEGIRRLKDAHAAFVELGVDDYLTALGLCNALSSLYEMKPSEPDLDASISHGLSALHTCGLSHRDAYMVIRALSYVQTGRAWFFYSDGPEYLDRVIDTLRTAEKHAPLLWKIMLLDELSLALNLRYLKQGNPEDVTEAVTRITHVLSACPDTQHIHSAQLRARLSIALHLRFKLTGMPKDIEDAAREAELATLRVRPGTSLHMDQLVALATCRHSQYVAFGNTGHLNQSMALFEQVMQSTTMESAAWNTSAWNMLECLPQRYEITRDIGDLYRAVELVPIVLASHGKLGTFANLCLHNAGTAILSCFENTGAPEYLDQATLLLKEAVEGSTRDAYEAHRHTGTYTKVLRIRYDVLHEQDSADKALHLHNELIRSLPIAHPDRARALCGWAHLQIVCANNIAGTLDSLAHALDNDYCPAYRRLKEVSDVLTHLHKHKRVFDHETAMRLSNVYSKAISLLPQVASFGLEPHVRLSVIANAGALTGQGAAHAISNGELELALEMLESGRTVFWTQGLHLRTSFGDLPEDIGSRLTQITYLLARPLPDSASEGPSKDRELARRRQLGDDFRSVLTEARLVNGFENLLQNMPFALLARAAKQHCVVVLVADESSGHSIIIQADAQCHLVGLPKANTTMLQALSRRIATHSKDARSSRGMRKVEAAVAQPTDIYQELWALVIAPIVETLGWPKSAGRQRPRLTLCPTGVFMQLPLHAAGIYAGDNPVSCSDYFVASYTPSISALLHAQRSLVPIRRSEARTLLVAADRPFQGAPLPMVTNEADTVQRLVTSLAEVVRASHCHEVLEHIQSAAILHLACHGTQHLSNPLQSSFHLEDGLLPVSKLMELELPSAFLAVLSACETAKGDTAQPDQAIHLAATMLFAGFKSVVATMWFMGDQEGPDIAQAIYSALFMQNATSEYIDPQDVPYALDNAVQKLRRSGLDPSFWATYIHIGV